MKEINFSTLPRNQDCSRFFSNRGFLRRRTELVLIGKGRYVKGRVTLLTRPFRHLLQLLCLFKYWLRQGSLMGKTGEFRVQKMEAELKAAAHFFPQSPTQFAPFFVVAPVLCPFSPILAWSQSRPVFPLCDQWFRGMITNHWQHDVTWKWLPLEKLNKIN